MKRIAILLAVVAALAGCQARSKPVGDLSQAATETGTAWRRCTDESFAAQRKLTPDRNQAAEAALAACYSEERAAAAVLAQNPAINVQEAIDRVRARAKATMMAQS